LVESVHCITDPDKIIITISALQDASVERERARLKGNLFTRVFGRKLVIE
jgi:hypothetical protein